MAKLKTYVLMVSSIFPAYHPRKGQYTFFKEAIEAGVAGKKLVTLTTSRRPQIRPVINEQDGKVHTIRQNYDLWAHRAQEINAGRAVLSLRQWTGKPYLSKQNEFLRLEKIGIQRFKISKELGMIHIDDRVVSIEEHSTVAQNDGLSQQDFYDWFKLGRKETTGAIIQFTDFSYT